jgi:hypothetical protein
MTTVQKKSANDQYQYQFLKTIVFPTKEEIISNPDSLKSIFMAYLNSTKWKDFTISTTDFLDALYTSDPTIDLESILPVIKLLLYNDNITFSTYRDRESYLMQKIIEHYFIVEKRTIGNVLLMIDNNVPYQSFKDYLKSPMKITAADKLMIVKKIMERNEYCYLDIQMIGTFRKIISQNPDILLKLFEWVMKAITTETGVTTELKKIYDMLQSSDRFQAFNLILTNDDIVSAQKSPLLTHMLSVSTPEELPKAKDLIFNFYTRSSYNIRMEGTMFYILLDKYTVAI